MIIYVKSSFELCSKLRTLCVRESSFIDLKFEGGLGAIFCAKPVFRFATVSFIYYIILLLFVNTNCEKVVKNA